MTEYWAELLSDLIRVALLFCIIPVVIFIAYLLDLRFMPEQFEVVEGSGKKGRKPRRNPLRIE